MKDLIVPIISILSTMCAYLAYKTSQIHARIETETRREKIIQPCRDYLLKIRNYGSLLLNVHPQTKSNEKFIKQLPPACSFTNLPLNVKSSLISCSPELQRSIRWLHTEVQRLEMSFNLRFSQRNMPPAHMLVCEEADFLTYLLEMMMFCEHIDRELVFWSTDKIV